ncbi:endonuclease III [Candidatus Dojkabacteria bacterium]|uniref:Endonuclease III n=1 Tax=Candidatus Dojkabacteria bacterium TaxID=2099670 RepID=A0A955I806_9BACT|nr:endonuclease III [Candidatus Dojkabacteria bacterium]
MEIDPDSVIERLENNFPNAKSELEFKNPFELLIATILSAQCTDARVNKVTPILFKQFPTPQKMSKATHDEISKIIFSTGFYNQKAKKVIESSKKIVEDFNGKVPNEMNQLIRLPGVARKTANVVLYNAFSKNEGIAVDTHVIRISRLLGFTENKNPDKIEKDLMELFPREKWGFLSQSLVLYGRYNCKAKKHDTTKCFLGGH